MHPCFLRKSPDTGDTIFCSISLPLFSAVLNIGFISGKKSNFGEGSRWKPSLSAYVQLAFNMFIQFNGTPSHEPKHSFFFLRFAGWLPPSFLGQKAAGKGIKTSPSFLSRKHSCENNGIIIKQNKKCTETTFLVNLVIKQNSLKGPHSWTEGRTKIFGRGQHLNQTSKW